MSDNDTQTEAQVTPASQPTGTPSAETKTGTPSAIPYDRFKEVNDAYAAAKQKLAAIEAEEKKRAEEAKKAEEARLSEQNEFKTLAEKRAAELAAIAPKAELADRLLERIDGQNKARIERLPEAMRPLVPVAYDAVALSEWLDANYDRLAAPIPPNLDSGRMGDRSTGPKKIELQRRNW